MDLYLYDISSDEKDEIISRLCQIRDNILKAREKVSGFESDEEIEEKECANVSVLLSDSVGKVDALLRDLFDLDLSDMEDNSGPVSAW